MHWRSIWVTLVFFVAVCVASHFDISIRHFSVPAALVILLLAPLPRMLKEIPGMSRTVFYAGWGVIGVLIFSCLFTELRIYPWYFPYVNALGAGKPVYGLITDSNVDWNQALPEVRHFAEHHQLQSVALDSYGLSDDTTFVRQSHVWDCQAPVQADARRWAVVSANMILDGHNCSWLLDYPREELAGGSMYAFRLPSAIPPTGTPGGPPRPADRRVFLGGPIDFKAICLRTFRHPETIPELIKQMQRPPAAPPNK